MPQQFESQNQNPTNQANSTGQTQPQSDPTADRNSNDFLGYDPFGSDDTGAENFEGLMQSRVDENNRQDAEAAGNAQPEKTQNQQPANQQQQPPPVDPQQAMLVQLQQQLMQKQNSEQRTQALIRQREQYADELAKRFNTDDLRNSFGDDQAALMSKLLANVHISATEQAVTATQQMVQRQVPQMTSQQIEQLSDARAKEAQFFEKYPEISAPELRESIVSLGRAMAPQLAQMPVEERWARLASAAAAMNGVQLQQRQNNGGNGQNVHQLPNQFRQSALPPIGLNGGNGQSPSRQGNQQSPDNPFATIYDQVSAFQNG